MTAVFCGSKSHFPTDSEQIIRSPTLSRLSRLLSALLAQASTQVQISIKLLIAYDSAIISMGIARSKFLDRGV